ncbi:hypothetical protein FRC00_005756 [Tulasnella sp. 408]|nr:hypothetical protein FRC00_005756 [Tulasnella sp. 408]
MPHYTRTKAKFVPEEKASVDQNSDNDQEDHAVVQLTAKPGAKKPAPVAGTKSKPSTNPANKRPLSATKSDGTSHASADDEIAAKKKKIVSPASEDQDTRQPRPGVGDESDAAEPEGHAKSAKSAAYKTARSDETGTKKKGLARSKRMQSGSDDWDDEAYEAHYVSDEQLNSRIKALIEWEDDENNMYAPAKLPHTGDWAQVGGRREWTWCTSASSKIPIIFCCVGWVTFHAFYLEGEPKREVTVSIRMAERKDRGHLQKFLKRHTSDSATPEWDSVKFTRFQAKKEEAQAKPFENFYDARRPGSYGKEDARDLSVRDDLKDGDLVIIEATAIRFPASNSPGKGWGSSPGKGEKKWVARFRLMTMWKLRNSDLNSEEEDATLGPSLRKGKGKMI